MFWFLLFVSLIRLCLLLILGRYPPFQISLLFSADICHAVSSQKEYIRGCYFTNWSQFRPSFAKYLPEMYEVGLCTHIFYSYAGMDKNFKIRSSRLADGGEDRITKMTEGQGLYSRINALKQKQPGLKTLLSIKFFNGEYILEEMITKADNRRIFIESAIAFVRRQKFDGLHIDWLTYEYFVPIEREYSLLIQEMRESIAREAEANGQPQLLLTADFPGRTDQTLDEFDGQRTAEWLDFINVQFSSLYIYWEKTIAFQSPLFDHDGDQMSVSSAMLYWSRAHKIPREKLTVGLGTFGVVWNVPLSSVPPTVGTHALGIYWGSSMSGLLGMPAYYELCDWIQTGQFVAHYDLEQRAAFLFNGSVWVSYENERSFNEKLDWLIENGFGGAIARSLDMDDFQGHCRSSAGLKYPLISAIKAKLSGSRTKSVASFDTTSTRFVPSTPASQTRLFKCVAPGSYIDPDSCHSFYECDDLNRVYYVSCPAGLYFSRVSFMCDHPYLARCRQPNL